MKKVLLIEDDFYIRSLYKKAFEKKDYQVVEAESGEAGLEKAKKDDLDFIVLDLMLPDMDGFEILTRIRQDARFDTLPVLILSARADPEEISRGLELGADGYLTKPYLPNTLTGRVRTLLSQGRRQAE